ncbi:MAG: thioesterase family protein [Leptospirales bacterium]
MSNSTMGHHTYSISTRYADLDTQWHVNSAAYESFCKEARIDYLIQSGANYNDLLHRNIQIRPTFAKIHFHAQQGPNSKLQINTMLYNTDQGYHWKHDIFSNENEYPVCEVETLTEITANNAEFLEPGMKQLESNTFHPFPEFKNTCEQNFSKYTIHHIDMDAFHRVSTSTLWRLNEESRWRFLEEAGISFRVLKDAGFSLFWLQGSYEYGNSPSVNDEITVQTRICSLEGARIYICQDTYLLKTTKMIMRTKGEFITVAIEKSKPVRVPSFIKEAFAQYTEH